MGGRRKQYGELLGRPVLEWSLRPFLSHPRVGAVAVALPPDDADAPPGWLTGLDGRIRVVPGGETRLASVRTALDALDPGVEVIMVHDAARPLVTREIIDRCLERAAEGEGGVAGWPVHDTIKEVDSDGRIVSTPDRERLWKAQTPQAFPAAVLREAYRRGAEEGGQATDDAALVTRIGHAVRMVRGEPWNLKITHPEDVAVAERILALRAEKNPDAEVRSGVAEVADHIRSGGIAAYPTETVYGFGGLARGRGLEAVLRLKGRGADRPVLILVASSDQVAELRWSEEARRLAAAFWPGPLTLVLADPGDRFPAGVRGPGGGVAIRESSHPLARQVVAAVGEPVTSTSANVPGEAPARTAGEARDAAWRQGAGPEIRVLDGGTLPPSEPSTVVDCTGPSPRVLREGAIPIGRIRQVVPATEGMEREDLDFQQREGR